MATFGFTSTPTYGWDDFNNTANQVSQQHTMPTTGLITSISFYGAGVGGTVKAWGCVWDSSGNLLATGSGVNTSGGSASAGGQAWYTDTLTAPLFVIGGATISIGWFRVEGSGAFAWSFANDGGLPSYRTQAGGAPGAFGSPVTIQAGSVGIYATYTAVSMYVRNAANTGWNGRLVQVRNSANTGWNQRSLWIRNSANTGWNQRG